ncbi:MAG: M28 family peptidase [Saprospiraceae bacterium]|nr:M28 family peptidase [Saprospiraceae bacterium]
MYRYLYLLILSFAFPVFSGAQTNIKVVHAEAEAVLLGNFNPDDYAQADPVFDPSLIAEMLTSEISADSLKSYLEQMRGFGNRNTGSDTLSTTFGMGAARRWAFDKFESFSLQSENRLLVSYLQFDLPVGTMNQHRNIIAVLPGQGPQYQEVVLVEGHFDSRCEDVNDIECLAEGMEDNGSGSALVLELARVMSKFSYNRTIVFVLTTGEEQGLLGAEAFSTWFKDSDAELMAVFNNDIVGGIICGATASPPGCPGLNDIDSTNVRIYSQGTFNSRNKQLARFTKLEYQEMAELYMTVPMIINILSPEDRTGRGGDHIPFREKGFPAIRFTSANEHGDGNPSQANYEDRQHSMEDVLGVDTDGDMILDSFFVDFNYLARNTIINGNAIAMAALGPVAPTNFNVVPVNNGFEVSFDDSNAYGVYRIGVRTPATNDWDTVYTIYNTLDTIFGLMPDQVYDLSAATVDDNGVESLFSNEKFSAFTTGTFELPWAEQGLTLLQNHPNPFDDATVIGVQVDRQIDYKEAWIVVHDLTGRELAKMPISLTVGRNEVAYDFQNHEYVPGVYAYSLIIDGAFVESRQMIYAY